MADQTYTIDLPQPQSEQQLFERLAAVVKFANKLGLAGQLVERIDFGKTTTTIVPQIVLTAHCGPGKIGAN